MPSSAKRAHTLNGPGTSNWLKVALSTTLNLDPVDAINDAKLLAVLLKHRLNQTFASEVANLHIDQAKRKYKYGSSLSIYLLPRHKEALYMYQLDNQVCDSGLNLY